MNPLERLHPAAFAVLALGIVFVLYQLVGGTITLLIAGGRFAPDTITLVRWSTLVGQLLFILIPTVVLIRLRKAPLADTLRLKIPGLRQLLLGLVAIFSLQQILQGYMTLQDAIPLPETVRQYVEMFRRMYEETYTILVSAADPLEFSFVVLTVALVPAIAEEFLFRGLVQSSFSEAAGSVRGAVLTGLIFGAYHLNPFSIVPLIILGIYFGFLVQRSGSVYVAVGAHFLNNFAACLAAYLQLNDEFLVIAPLSEPTPALQLTNVAVSAVVFAGATLLFMRSTEESST